MSAEGSVMGAEKRKRRKRRSPVGYITVIVILLTLISLLIFEHFFPLKKIPVGTWIHEEDITQTADDAMCAWLRSAEPEGDDPFIYPESEPVYVDLVLAVNSDGTYERYVDEDSYEAARAVAYRNLETALGSLINARFKAVGMAEGSGMSEDDIAKLMDEAVGMSVEEYLHKAVPDILPSYEEYSADISGRGTCAVEGDLIIFDDHPGEILLFDDDRMLIGDVVYLKADDEE
jgi:hypothetical protein